MATFLTTRKMHPALAARIEARISGRRAEPGRALAPLAISALRFAGLAVVVSLVVSFAVARQRDRSEIADTRRALLERIRSDAAALTSDDFAMPARAEAWLVRSAAVYAGDFVAEELRPPGALAAKLRPGVVYARGDLASFASTGVLRAIAGEARKDAFVLCLGDPPAEQTEKAQLRKVYAAYAGGARIETPIPHVRLLAEAQIGLPLLSPAWQAEVEAADTHAALAHFGRAYEQAPIAAAKQAAKARLLLFVMDEPGDTQGPSELDGERPHPVRVGLVDLARDRPLLRLRRRVDPKWISAGRRADYARGLDSCALALDVRDSVGNYSGSMRNTNP